MGLYGSTQSNNYQSNNYQFSGISQGMNTTYGSCPSWGACPFYC